MPTHEAKVDRSEAFRPAEWTMLAMAAVLFGSGFFFMATGLDTLSPPVVVLLGQACGLIALSLIPGSWGRVGPGTWSRIVLLSITWMALPRIMFTTAQLWMDSSFVGMVYGTFPLFALLIAAALAGRRPEAVLLKGISVGLVGMVAILWPNIHTSSARVLGIALVLAGTLLQALSVNLMLPLQQLYGAARILLRMQAVALLVLAPLGIAFLPGSEPSWGSVFAIAAWGFLGMGVAMVVSANLMGRVGPGRAGTAIYLSPVVAVTLGISLRGEAVSPVSLGGVGLVFAGVFLVSRRIRQ